MSQSSRVAFISVLIATTSIAAPAKRVARLNGDAVRALMVATMTFMADIETNAKESEKLIPQGTRQAELARCMERLESHDVSLSAKTDRFVVVLTPSRRCLKPGEILRGEPTTFEISKKDFSIMKKE